MIYDEFRKWDGTQIADVRDYIKGYLSQNGSAEFIIMIGVDSIPYGFFKGKAVFSEVICLWKWIDGVSHGAHIIYRRSKKIKVTMYGGGTHGRLMTEAYRLVEIAQTLRDAGIDTISNVRKLDPQLDFNKKPNWESNKYLAEAVGYVNSMGFECNVKPDSPAASYAADHICRYKEKKQ